MATAQPGVFFLIALQKKKAEGSQQKAFRKDQSGAERKESFMKERRNQNGLSKRRKIIDKEKETGGKRGREMGLRCSQKDPKRERNKERGGPSLL